MNNDELTDRLLGQYRILTKRFRRATRKFKETKSVSGLEKYLQKSEYFFLQSQSLYQRFNVAFTEKEADFLLKNATCSEVSN